MAGIKGPTPTAEADYMHSMVSSTSDLRFRLSLFTPVANRVAPPAGVTIEVPSPQGSDLDQPLTNRDLDTGLPVKPGGYRLTVDLRETYGRLTRHPNQPIPPGIKRDVLAYYADPNAPIITKKKHRAWQKVQDELKTLATMPTSNEPEPYPTYGRDLGKESAETPGE